MTRHPSAVRPHVLAIVPPYSMSAPPHGVAALMGHLKAHGCDDFDVLDLRLYTSTAYAPTYRAAGTFGETYVLDVPDLPLVLRLLAAFDAGRPFALEQDAGLTSYCFERGINPRHLVRYLTRLDLFLERSLASLPGLRFVGLPVWTSNLLTTLMACAHLKRRADPPFVVLGGPQVTESEASARLALHSGLADAVIPGEGEQALLDLYRAFDKADGDPGPVPGVLRFDPVSGAYQRPERKLLRITDKALPDFSCLPILAYQDHGFPDTTLVPFEISRGCTNHCTFCSEWVFWERFRPDSTEHVLDQMEQLVARHGVNGFLFSDSLLNGVPERLRELAEGILARGLELRWGGFLRAEIDDDTARLIERAGCRLAFVGVESLSDETLEAMNKRMTSAGNLAGLEALLGAGIARVAAGFIPGFPGDTTERFLATALALNELQSRYPLQLRVNVEPFVITPGQTMSRELERYGLQAQAWSDEVLDLAPAYREITAGIHHSVTGANQGVERNGQLRVAATLNAADPLALHAFPDPYLYPRSEDLDDRDFVWSPLAPGWELARFKSPWGVRSAIVCSAEEKAGHGARMIEDRTPGQLEATFAAFVAAVRERHLFAPDLDHPRLAAVANAPTWEGGDDGLLSLSPFALCRDTGEGDAPLLLVDLQSRRRERLEACCSGALVALHEAPMTAREWAARLVRDGLTGPRAEALRDALLAAGLLVLPCSATRPAPVEAAAPR